MDEKTKLYVFTKREAALIFIFALLIAFTAFIFGIKVGRDYSFEAAGFEQQDRDKVELLSGQEEIVNKIVEEEAGKKVQEEEMIESKELNKRIEDKIKEELLKENLKKKSGQLGEDPEPKKKAKVIQDSISEKYLPKKDSYSGKYTIQLSSHRTLKEAEDFAEGFRSRGYDPIIDRAKLPDRGTWYRVRLGVFGTVSEAKKFVKSEESLFQGQDHFYVRFD